MNELIEKLGFNVFDLLGKEVYLVRYDANGEVEKEFNEQLAKGIEDYEKEAISFYKGNPIIKCKVRTIEIDNEPELNSFSPNVSIQVYYLYKGKYGKARRHLYIELKEYNETWFTSKEEAIKYLD